MVSRTSAQPITVYLHVNAYVKHLSTEDQETLNFLCANISSVEDGIRGRIVKYLLSKDELDAIEVAGLHVPDDGTMTFQSYRWKKTLYHAKTSTLWDSSVCEFEQQGIKTLGSIRRFCILQQGPVAIIDVFERLHEGILHGIAASRPLLAANEEHLNRFFVKVNKKCVTKTLTVAFTNCLIQKCIHIPVKHSPTDTIAYLPNLIV